MGKIATDAEITMILLSIKKSQAKDLDLERKNPRRKAWPFKERLSVRTTRQ